MNLKRKIAYPILVIIFFVSLFFLISGIESKKTAINYRVIEDDINVDSSIIPYIFNGNLIIEYQSDVKPKIQGYNLDYNIETNRIIIYNYNNEYFRLIFGGSSDVYQFGDPDYIIDGDKVYVNDSRVYLVTQPHTIYSSGWINFNLTSKVYEGDIDVVWGFDTTLVKPKLAEYYSPYYWNETKSYTCNPPYWYNYTLDPKYFWCWEDIYVNITNAEGFNETYLMEYLVFDHSFETWNKDINTTYWNETFYKEFKDMTHTFSSINYDYRGMNKWYYIKNISIEANKEYWVRWLAEVVPQFSNNSGKYWFCIKKSSDTIQEAIANDRFYCLDPWWNSSYSYKRQEQINQTGTTLLTNFPYIVNGTFGFNLSTEPRQFVWTIANISSDNTTFNYLYYNNYSYYAVTNGSENEQLPMEVERGNGTSYSYTSVWDSNFWYVHHFWNGAGTVVNDSTINARNGTFMTQFGASMPIWSENGVFGRGIWFNGSGIIVTTNVPATYVDLGFNITGNITSQMTVEAWFNLKDNSKAGCIACRSGTDTGGNRKYEMWYGGSGSTAFQCDFTNVAGTDSYATAGWSTPNDVWYYWVCVYNSSHVLNYVNGTLVATNTQTGNLKNPTSVKITDRIGASGNGSLGQSYSVNATIDEVKISNVARSADYIKRNWEMGLARLGSEQQPPTPPTYSLNSTNSTLAGTPVLHSLNWTSSVGLSGYIFSFHNGSNWTDGNCGDYLTQSECIGFGCSWNPFSCSGSPSDCTVHGTQGACELCGCTWSSGGTEPTQILYEDFNEAGNGTTYWTLGNWGYVTNSAACKDDANDDCVRSSTLDTDMYYSSDIDLSSCIDGTIWVSGYDYDYLCDQNEDLDLKLSSNSGSGWASINDIDVGSRADGAGSFNQTGITGYNVATFRVGFGTTGTDSGEYWYVDDVKIGCAVALPSSCDGTEPTCSNQGESACDECGCSETSASCSGTPNYEMKNDTWESFSGTWSNVTKIVNSTEGATIKWCVYANDTNNNWNATSCEDPFSYLTISGEVADATFSIAMPSDYSWTEITGTEEGTATATAWISLNFSDIPENYTEPSVSGDFNKNQSGIAQPIFYIDATGNTNIDILLRLNQTTSGINVYANASCTGTYASCENNLQLIETTYVTLVDDLSQTDSYANITLYGEVLAGTPPNPSGIKIYIRSMD